MDGNLVFSIIIPARNEEAMIAGAVESALNAASRFEARNGSSLHLHHASTEILVVDNASTDGTAKILNGYIERHGVRRIVSHRLKAPCARNDGAAQARGRILIFMDADTRMSGDALSIIGSHVDCHGCDAGITRLASLEGGIKAWCWWAFWGQVRRLPLARAKAMPAFMFCTREVFDRFGPFDEEVAIGEEWPILGGVYRDRLRRLIYDRSLTARSSNRRMALQRFGYVANFAKYVWAVLHKRGRINYTDRYRHSLRERWES